MKYILLRIFVCGFLLYLSGCQANKVFETDEAAQLSAEEYRAELAKLDTGTYYLIDVRTAMEHKGSRIEGAENISYLGGNFGKQAAQLDTSKLVFVYCQTAHRSPYAANKLRKLGFQRIIDLAGGFKAWQAAGFPIEEER